MGCDCVKIWGEAYGTPDSPQMMTIFRSFATPEHDYGVDGYGSLSTQYQHHHQYQQPSHGIFSTAIRGRFGIDWPEAVQHPLFYVGIYAAIGLASALSSVLSVTAQYTGALRASRVLFK
jgi:hypothetical protein